MRQRHYPITMIYMRATGRFVAALAFALVAVFTPSPFAQAQEVDWQKLAKSKAALVLNFIRYTQWPAETFASADDPVVVTVLGHADVLCPMSDAVMNQDAQGRRIVIHRLSFPRPSSRSEIVSDEELEAFVQALRRTHVLYIGSTEEGRMRDVLRALSGANVLTVSDIPRFAESGGMLGLVRRENRVAFDANPGEIKKTQLNVSSKMLKLARIVETQ